jgi:alpha-glucosidase
VEEWWRRAVVYQVYPRSFSDGSGDGVGDLAGLRERLGHLRDLGVDALWLSPWYVSPFADGGYDVADYRDVDPRIGTLAEAEAFFDEAHALGLKVLLDIVPNHCSDQHPWFQAALRAGPGSPQRQLFHFRPGRGDHGELPPNDWYSAFGGLAWTRVTEPDGQPGEWYLHLFAPEQPDWNWSHETVRAEFDGILRFWFDRGVDGFRIDVADSLSKPAELPNRSDTPGGLEPHRDNEGNHEIYRRWRRIADSYPQPRIFVGELWLTGAPERLARYLRPDELHSAFNFDLLSAAWDADEFRAIIDASLHSHTAVGAPATWVLSNHDVHRTVTRYGRADTRLDARLLGTPTDLALGTARARAALLLSAFLPGELYLYQGEELGLPEVEEIPDALREDPIFWRTAGANRGRDGCRVPLPWSGDEPPYGFSPPDASAAPWLPQPAGWKALTVHAESLDADSTLALYRRVLRLRRELLRDAAVELEWLPMPPGVLAARRQRRDSTGPEAVVLALNMSAAAVPLPPYGPALVASADLAQDDTVLRPNTAVWLST